MKLVYESRHYVYNLKSNIAREYTSGIHVYQFSIQRVYIYHFIDRKLVSEKFNWHSFTASQIFFSVQLISAFIKMVNSCRVCNDFNYEWLIYSCYLNVF